MSDIGDSSSAALAHYCHTIRLWLLLQMLQVPGPVSMTCARYKIRYLRIDRKYKLLLKRENADTKHLDASLSRINLLLKRQYRPRPSARFLPRRCRRLRHCSTSGSPGTAHTPARPSTARAWLVPPSRETAARAAGLVSAMMVESRATRSPAEPA